jgi:excisionase family DNA binding protein
MLEQKVEGFCFAKEAYKVTPFQIRTFWTHVLAGRIPSYKIGKHRLFRKSEVIAAIEKCRVRTNSEVLS